MNSLMLLSCWIGSAVAYTDSLDDFHYADPAAAQAVWKVIEHTPPLQIVTAQNRPVTVLDAPFASQPKLRRAVMDRDVSLDLRSAGGFQLDAAVAPSEFPLQLSLYFHSGQGWYHSGGVLESPQRQTLSFSKNSFVSEGKPDGWRQIDKIRIAVWRPAHQLPSDSQIRWYGLTAVRNPVTIVAPSPKSFDKNSSDQKLNTSKRTQTMRQQLANAGLEVDVLNEDLVATGALDRHRIALLLDNPDPSPACVAALERFIQSGGKLLVCRWLSERLGPLLGFNVPKPPSQEVKGDFAEMRFEQPHTAGLPTSIRQQVWKITSMTPVSQNARILARWYDKSGQSLGDPAVLLSDRGAMISHVLPVNDPTGNQSLLTSLLGQLDPMVWRQIARTRIDRIGQVGHCTHLDETLAYLRQSGRSFGDVHPLIQQASQQLESGESLSAIETADRAHGLLVDAYVRSLGSPSREARATWDHSGLGAYPGDWERSAKLLAKNGFNMVLPNMLWGGAAHYASDVLPRSETYAKYGDQLQACCEAAHRHGLEVHVWKVNFYLGGHASKAWIVKMRAEGRMQVSVDGKPCDWLCPSNPANRKLELDAMLEVARNYPVDGLHFDYIRYPDREHCYCDGCRKRFEADSGRPVVHWPADCYSGDRQAEYNAWRCRQITALVEAVRRETRKLRPELKISAAVFGSYPACRKNVAQDWVSWVKAGDLDFVCPMDYTNNLAKFHRLVASQKKRIDDRVPLYPGIGVLSSCSRLSMDQAASQIRDARLLGAAGYVIFNFNQHTANTIFPSFGWGAGAKPARPPHRIP